MRFVSTPKLFFGCNAVIFVFVIVYTSYSMQYSVAPGQQAVLLSENLIFHERYNFQSPTIGENNIIFLETSCVINTAQYESMELKLSYMQACAIESAANTNPNASIYLFYSCPLDNTSLSMSSQVVQRVFDYSNVHVWHESGESFFAGTPLEEFFNSGKMNTSKYPIVHASDVMRLLVLWKYGGIYLDLDFVVMRSLDTLDKDFIGAECCEYMANGALGLSTVGVGKKIIDLFVEEIRTNFNGEILNHNGPAMVTRVLRLQCGLDKTELMTKEACGGFAVLPPNTFYPIMYNWQLFFNESQSDSTMIQIRKGHAVHLWHAMILFQGGGLHLLRPGSEQPLALLHQEFCPVVHEETLFNYLL